ncbi:sensor domain-containing diguanylate cyclase [Halomonas daqiaonensis]|uniref:diguanylate cyclase n=1 Tax=Halomonas daqiaonensis TaxID=650850 RepID=A0A1H7FXW0_9GAMM|nr:sensor domain-containing diguanylate cyclase [Halomonas daqiaonensis]SEK30087.1 diguanylate cyclase (GGDEF) domain-containing protein [Halomonas daqiaonensis]
MSLKTRFLLLAAALVLLASAAAWIVFHRITEGIIEQWGERIATIQVQYDSGRLLQPLEREIALARQMADSLVLERWAANPDDPLLQSQAFAEMESFRRNFRDNSYFVALRDSGAYYHNNADNDYAGDPFRYFLRPDRPADAWFYRLIEEGRDFHLNVNPDVELGVTKLWIDVLMRDASGEILGVIGTGMELEGFLEEIIDIQQPGITTLFVDYNGAIQLYRDRRLIDYGSFVKPEGQKRTLDLLVDLPEDAAALETVMRELRNAPDQGPKVRTVFVTVEGKRHLAGVAFLPSIGWFEVTLLDLGVLMPLSSFTPVAVVFVLTLLVTLLLFHLVLRRQILAPVSALESAMARVREGDFSPAPLTSGHGEMGRLITHFRSMAEAIRLNTRELEQRVRERTEELERLASRDVLTGLMNRRGMQLRLEEEVERASREASPFGLIWLDLDHFKKVNDTLGHAAGDRALTTVADVLQETLRPYDQAARWGGDEFLVLLSPCDADNLLRVAERLRHEVKAQVGRASPITISIGACLSIPGESLDAMLLRADEALYQAKDEGRNAARVLV